MTQTTGRLFDEIAKVMTNAAGAVNSVREEVDTLFRAQAERMVNDMDLVPREEFDAMRDMAAKARMENGALEKRIAALETQLAKKPAKRSKSSAPKKST